MKRSTARALFTILATILAISSVGSTEWPSAGPPWAEFAPETQIVNPPLPPQRPSEAELRVIPLGTTPGFGAAAKAEPTPVKPVALDYNGPDCPLKRASVTLKDGRTFLITRVAGVYTPGPIDKMRFLDPHPLDGNGYNALQVQGPSGRFVIMNVIGVMKGFPEQQATLSYGTKHPTIRWGHRERIPATFLGWGGVFLDHTIEGGPLDGATIARFACKAGQPNRGIK